MPRACQPRVNGTIEGNCAPLRAALAELMAAAGLARRVGTNLNEAVTRLNATGERAAPRLPGRVTGTFRRRLPRREPRPFTQLGGVNQRCGWRVSQMDPARAVGDVPPSRAGASSPEHHAAEDAGHERSWRCGGG